MKELTIITKGAIKNCLFVMLFLTIPALVKGKLYRSQGIILFAVYALYVVGQFVL